MKRSVLSVLLVLAAFGLFLIALRYGTPDKRAWRSISTSTNAGDYASFLNKFPNSEFAEDARACLKPALIVALDSSFNLIQTGDYQGAKTVLEALVSPGVTNALALNNYAVVLAHQDRSDKSLQEALRILKMARGLSEKQVVPNLSLRVNTVLMQYWNTPSLHLNAFLSADSALQGTLTTAARKLTADIIAAGGSVAFTREQALLLLATSDWGNHSTVVVDNREYVLLSDEIDNNIAKVNLLLQHPNREND